MLFYRLFNNKLNTIISSRDIFHYTGLFSFRSSGIIVRPSEYKIVIIQATADDQEQVRVSHLNEWKLLLILNQKLFVSEFIERF